MSDEYVSLHNEIKEHLEKKWMTSLDHQRSTYLLRKLMEEFPLTYTIDEVLELVDELRQQLGMAVWNSHVMARRNQELRQELLERAEAHEEAESALAVFSDPQSVADTICHHLEMVQLANYMVNIVRGKR
jgi:regulator of replication initiation timing